MKLNLTKPLAVIDLETTGLMVGSDRIIEICIIRLNIDGSRDIKTMRINPTIPISSAATKVHGITDDDVKDCPSFAQVAHQLFHFINDCDIAGYNSNKFDVPLLVEEFLRAGLEFDFTSRKYIDVQNIFHRMEPRNLKAAYKFYCGRELLNAHSAEADTLATLEILESQLDKYQDTEYTDADGKTYCPVVNNVQALHDFSFKSNHADLVGHLVFNSKNQEVFNFGKHKGKAVEEVFTSEPSYYDWMMKSDFPLSTKKIITSIKLRGFNKSSVKI